MTATTERIVLNEGDSFTHHGMTMTVAALDLATDRYDLTATYNGRPLPGSFRWRITYVAFLLTSEKAKRVEPTVERCGECGEPFRDGARFGDEDERCEIVVDGESKVVHVECGIALAAERGTIIDALLA